MAPRRSVQVHPLPIPLLIHIVNQWGDAPRNEANTASEPYPTAESLREQSPTFWSHLQDPDEQTLVATANLIYPIFAAATGAECAQHLNRLMVKAAMRPALTSQSWAIDQVWQTAYPDRALLAGATLSLIDQLRHEPDASRLGTCCGDACVDIYVDHSPAARRQYCSLTCQNRARTRAYRANKRAAATHVSS